MRNAFSGSGSALSRFVPNMDNGGYCPGPIPEGRKKKRSKIEERRVLSALAARQGRIPWNTDVYRTLEEDDPRRMFEKGEGEETLAQREAKMRRRYERYEAAGFAKSNISKAMSSSQKKRNRVRWTANLAAVGRLPSFEEFCAPKTPLSSSATLGPCGSACSRVSLDWMGRGGEKMIASLSDNVGSALVELASLEGMGARVVVSISGSAVDVDHEVVCMAKRFALLIHTHLIQLAGDLRDLRGPNDAPTERA